jgi:hypothetical protein
VLRNQREAADLTGEIRRKYRALMELEQHGVRQPRRLEQKWPWAKD